MQIKAIPTEADGPDARAIQRAIMGVTLAEFPAKLTLNDVRAYFDFGEPVNDAINVLILAGLLWREGYVVLPTLAARHFDWLEQG